MSQIIVNVVSPSDKNGHRLSADVFTSLYAKNVDVIHRVGTQLGIDVDDQAAVIPRLVAVGERRFSQILTVLVVEAMAPLLQERAFLFFRHQKHESIDDALDLSQTLVTKILQSLVGHWPHGNVGAWVATIRANLYADHNKRRDRERQLLSKIEDRWNSEHI